MSRTPRSPTARGAQLFVPHGVGRDALATLSEPRGVPGARPVDVTLRTLDEYRLDDVTFVKIDVEGHEFEVLRGAERTLTRWSPTLLVEIDRAFHNQPIRNIFDWLGERGYVGRFRRDRAWVPLSGFEPARDQRPGEDVKSVRYVSNFVFTRRNGTRH